MSFTSVYINNETKHTIKVHDRDELILAVQQEIDKLGYDANLNHIDVSSVSDFYGIFENSEFVGDISNWDVSNGEIFSHMFMGSKFNSNLLRWNVSKGKYFSYMFADSEFNQDISLWNVKNAISLDNMFLYSKFDYDLDMWDVSKVSNMTNMFRFSKYTHKLESWKPECCICKDMFAGIFIKSSVFELFKEKVPNWYYDMEVKYNDALRHMHDAQSFPNNYSGMTYDMLTQLNIGKHSVYLDRETCEVLGHDNKKRSCEFLYSFVIKKGMDEDDYSKLYAKIKDVEKRKLQLVYKTTLGQVYPFDFVDALPIWNVRQNPYKSNISSIQLYCLKCVNWHAEQAGIPKVYKEYKGKLSFCR